MPWTEYTRARTASSGSDWRGRFDVQTSTEIRDGLVAAAAGAGDGTLVVDLDLVTFLESRGLSALIAGLKASRARGGRMHIVNPSPVVARTLEITGMTGQFGLDSAGAGENVDVGGEQRHSSPRAANRPGPVRRYPPQEEVAGAPRTVEVVIALVL